MEQFTKEMLARLDALASKLGVAAATIWGFYIRQAKMEGILHLVYLACTLGAGLFCLVVARRRVVLYKAESSRDKNVDRMIMATVLCIVAGVFIVWSCYNLHEAVTALGNPGYYAFQTITEQLKGN